MFIISAFKHDTRLRQGVQYIESVLQAYQRDSRLNPSIQFPFELQFDEIGVVLDEHSDDYTAGEKSTTIRSAFNSDAINGLAYKATNDPMIRALTSRPRHENPYRKSKSGKQDYDRKHDKRTILSHAVHAQCRTLHHTRRYLLPTCKSNALSIIPLEQRERGNSQEKHS